MNFFYPLVAVAVLAVAPLMAGTLEEDFLKPPDAARPMVWWHWMGRNISREGITKDLEAMKASGIGGATIFNLTSSVQSSGAPLKNSPWPENDYRGPAWWGLVEHAAREGDRLGLNLGMHNCVGYSATGGPWITPENSMKTVVWTMTPVPGGKTFVGKPPQPPAKLNFYRDIGVVAVPDGVEADPNAIQDLSGSVGPDSTLTWVAPAGAWTIYRFGYTTTGSGSHPAPEEVKTLECDKLNAGASKFHFEQVLGPLRDHLGPLLGKSLRHITLDSYEAGNLNWTEGFREEFKRRRGYDPLRWLPALDPRIVIGNADLTARFRWDMKTTVSDLFVQNNFRQGRRMLNELGLSMYLEPYSGPFDTVEAATAPDMTMGEFWLGSSGEIPRNIVGSAQAAGIRVIGAEAFTGRPNDSRFAETPALLKSCGDGAWVSGINQLFLHHWVHQPLADELKPGMGMGWWGTHFGRNQTWYEPGKAWIAYLGRSQALLQRGEPVADYLALDQGAGLSANRADTIAASDLGNATVQGGRIRLPSGRTYAFLLLPNNPQMLPATARQIKALVASGATVAGRRPERSPSLQGFPAADAEVATIGNELWVNQAQVFANAEAALGVLHLSPDFTAQPAPPKLRYAHRRDGETEIYFLTNGAQAAITFTASLRVTGMVPELWDAEQGTHRMAPVWRSKDGRTDVDLTLEANTSVFIVLRQPTREMASVPLPESKPPPEPIGLNGPWDLDFGHGQTISLPALASWTSSDIPAVKYFSGTATYRKTIVIPSHEHGVAQLNLGVVKELASVKVNGMDCGVTWHAPFRVNVGSALKAGTNTVEIQVTNTWANRLIGDEQETPDADYGQEAVQKTWKNKDGSFLPVGRMLVEFPDWILHHEPRPSKRQAFCTWNYFNKDSPLLEAGLIGPVTLSFTGPRTE